MPGGGGPASVIGVMDVPGELRTWVDGVEVHSGADGPGTFVHVPDVAPALVFRITGEGRSDLMVVGPRSRGSYHPSKQLPVCIRLRVRPGRSRALLGLPINELADRVVPLADLWGAPGRRLAEELATAPGRRSTRIAAALRERAAVAPATVALEPALRALSAGASTSAAADRLGISERHLRNVFARDVGLSPKQFARIARLRRVLDLAGDRAWARVAGDTGYFDQAHMITDFRALMGVSPGAFAAGRLPPPSPCMGLTRVRSLGRATA